MTKKVDDFVRQFTEDAELVLGLVAPLGTDLDGVTKALGDRLENTFQYDPHVVRLSELLTHFDFDLEEHPPEDRYRTYMDAGDDLRSMSARGDALALYASSRLSETRIAEDGTSAPQKRTTHIFRSLKHPDEVQSLRAIYGSGFFLIGVHAGHDTRLEYLTEDKNIDESIAKCLISRDEDDAKAFGQRTRDTFQLADAFVSIESSRWKDQLFRILDLLFGSPSITPTKDEHAMHLAHAASLMSGDLSRQVGAVVVDADDEVVATGYNDAPRYSGGLYSEDDPSGRDWTRRCDANEVERKKISDEIADRLEQEFGLDRTRLNNMLEDSRVFQITEYGRAVHAEMEAIIACARTGTSVRGGTLYSTTFPCHNCAKHIVAAGIERVVYVEPYPKSKALELHNDAISISSEPEDSKVHFEAFVGIGPRRFVDLFSIRLGRGPKLRRKQKGGSIVEWPSDSPQLRISVRPQSYLAREKLSVSELDTLQPEDTEGDRDVEDEER